MKPRLCIKILLVGITCMLADVSVAQQVLTADDHNQSSSEETATIAALRSLSIKIAQCQETFVSEAKWGKGPREVSRFYIGAPKNVVWRSERVAGVPDPLGYIEFSSSFYWRVPLETAKKFGRSRIVVMASDAHVTPDGVPFAPSFDGSPSPDTDYRYEFDLRLKGPQLVNVVSRSSPKAAWQMGSGHPCGPRLEKLSQ